MDEPEAVLRWLDDLGALDRDGAGVVFAHDADVPSKDVLARLTDNLTVTGVELRLTVFLGRDYMPGGKSHSLTAIAALVTDEPAAVPAGVRPERVVVISEGGEIWTAPLNDGRPFPEEASIVDGIARGPDPKGRNPWEPGYVPTLPWDTGRRTDVLVRLRDPASAVHVLRAPEVIIAFSS